MTKNKHFGSLKWFTHKFLTEAIFRNLKPNKIPEKLEGLKLFEKE